MGGGGDTKKSFAEVQQDLQDQLLANAKKLLKTDFNVDADSSWQLEDILYQLAFHRFQDRFKFSFSDDPANCNPPDSIGGVTTVAKLCSITDPTSDQAKNYIEQTIFSKVDLPPWVAANAKADLVTLATGLIGVDTNKQWLYSEYVESFDAAIEDQKSWKVEADLVYVNGSLSEDGLNANLCIIYFMGVYYNIKSEAKATRDALQAEAYSTAKTTTGFASSINTDQNLSDALLEYGKTIFNKKFGFAFGSTPPDYPKDARTPSIAYNGHLAYLPDLDKLNTIPALVKNEIFSGINIGVDSIKTQATADVTAEFQTILKAQSTQSWTINYIDNTYGISDPAINPIRNRGVIFYFYDHQTTASKVTVSVTYIFYMAMFYEIYPAEIALARDLLIDLCNDLIEHIEGESSTSRDVIALQQYLKEYSKKQFQDNFGFDFDSGTPPDQKGKTVRRFSALCNPTAYPPGADEVTKFMTNELFDNNSALFPPYARAPIYDNVVQHLNRYLGTDTVKDASFWYTSHQERYYDDPAGQKDSVHERVVYVYALGKKREDSVGGGELVRVYAYYFAVYNGCDKSDGGDEW
ncbi:hypothetical protein AX16_005924 [Volvariella volvacea WC 439]|nr:hypothetical protein AX16_005924 [Volvariella volvacea WC 439]